MSATKIGESTTNNFKLLFFMKNLHFITSTQIYSYRKLNLPLTNSICLVFLTLEMQRELKQTKVYNIFFLFVWKEIAQNSHCMQEILLKKDICKEDHQKALKKWTLFFLSNSVSFNGQSYQKQKGPGTNDQSLFTLQNKFRKIPLLVISYLTKLDGIIKVVFELFQKLHLQIYACKFMT